MTLGAYTYPSSGTYTNTSPTNSANTMGLQEAFFTEVSAVIDEFRNTSYGSYNGIASINSNLPDGVYAQLSNCGIACYVTGHLANAAGQTKKGKTASYLKSLFSNHGITATQTSSSAGDVVMGCSPAKATSSSSATGVVYESPSDVASSEQAEQDTKLWQGSDSNVEASYWVLNNLTSQTTLSLLFGEKQFLRDKPVLTSIKTLVNSTMRTFTSSPEGKFVCWWPDRWGQLEETEVFTISDIELIDFQVTQSFEQIATHVYVQGSAPPGTSSTDLTLWQYSTGMVYLGMTGLSEFINFGVWKEFTTNNFYTEYGLRPYVATAPSTLIYNSIQPFLYALDQFLEKWSSIYTATISCTFMPEVMPGMLVTLESYGITWYVTSVNHNMNYHSGFTTTLGVSCPSGTMFDGMVNVSNKVSSSTSVTDDTFIDKNTHNTGY